MPSETRYEPLLTQRPEDEESQSHHDDHPSEPKSAVATSPASMPRWRRPEPWSWLLTVLFVVSNAMWLLITLTLFFAASKGDAAEPRFATDLADAQPAVKYMQKVYTNTLMYNETSKHVQRVIDPDEPQYFGPPSREIDEAWGELLHGEFMAMKPEEAEPFEPELKPLSDGKFHMELEVLHELHCLNVIRMQVDYDYYKDKKHAKESKTVPWTSQRDHLDHCFNLLFQSVKCHSDLTPVPMYGNSGFPHTVGRGGPHTCRDWSSIHDWYKSRNTDGSAITEFKVVNPA